MSQSEIDGARISDLKGAASLDGSALRTLTVTEPVEFTYNCGSGQTMVVSLNVYAANQWGRELSMEGWKYGETAKRPTATARFDSAASVKTGAVTSSGAYAALLLVSGALSVLLLYQKKKIQR